MNVADLLDEYAEALRGDWGSIDGRSERMKLQELAERFREHGNEDLTQEHVTRYRLDLNVCVKGCGSWEFHCDHEEEG